MDLPTFGKPEPGIQYMDRPGAYGFLVNKNNELAVLATKWGVFLPGGGLDPGETDLSALKRELVEEMNVEILSAEFVCRAAQYLFSRHYQRHFRKIGSFYRVEAVEPIRLKMQQDHELLWMDKRRASLEISEEYQRWALSQI